MKSFFLCTMLCCLMCPAWAENNTTMTEDDIRRTANQITKELRCLSCQGQSVFDSESMFSVDVRHFVIKALRQGKTPDQIKIQLMEQYGQTILMTPPPTKKENVLLWTLPITLMLGVLIFFGVRFFTGRRPLEKQ